MVRKNLCGAQVAYKINLKKDNVKMSERDKKYLFLLDLSQGRGLPNKVTEAFMRKAFSTDSVLAVLTDVDKKSLDYINYTQRKIFGGGGSTTYLLAEKSN